MKRIVILIFLSIFLNAYGKTYDKNGYDSEGYDKNGYNEGGYDKEGYDKEGYNIRKFNKYGLYKDINGAYSLYDKEGYDKNGYDREGYDKNGYNKEGYDRENYDQYGYGKDGYDWHGYSKEGYKKNYNLNGYDRNGYDQYGYGKDGYNKGGYDKGGYDKEGYSKEGYNREGYNKEGYDKTGYNKEGYNREGYNKEGYDKIGYNKEGYTWDGYGKDGYDRNGYDQYGYGKEGYNKEGYNKEGYDKDGYNRKGFDKNRINKTTKTKYDNKGYDFFGYNIKDYFKSSDYNYYRTKKIVNISKDTDIIGALPQNIIVEIDGNSKEILKPLKGNINISDFEQMYTNIKDISFYTLNSTPIFADAEQTKVITNIEKGKKVDNLYYSNDLKSMVYIEDGKLKGWLSFDNIGILKNKYNKVAIINNNTNSYKVIDEISNSSYNSGDILEFDKVADDTGYYYSDKIGWVNKKDVIVINESNKNKRIFVNVEESEFNNDFTGYNYKNVPMGTEYVLLGITDKYNLVSSKLTGEKGWILKENMSFKKPDLNDPVILITKTNVDENNMLTISGKIYDDTAISTFLLNGNKMSTKPLSTFDKLGYVPEIGYSFTSQWFLVAGIENNIELKVIDRDGKSYSKILRYTPKLENTNLNEFQIENIVKKLPKLDYSTELKDENGDNLLTGSEKISLTVKVTNSGEGEAKNVTINLNNNTSNDLNYKKSYTLGTIQSNETKIAVIDISGQDNIVKGKALFDLQVNEQNGFNPFPAKLSFNVEPKLNPRLEIIDYAIDDENKNGQIEQGEKFDLYVLVQNTGQGDSKNTILEVNTKDKDIMSMDKTSYKYDILKSGESKKVKFSFVTNYVYEGNGDLPFEINLYNEKNTIKTQKPIILTLNKVMPTIKEINLEAKKKEIIVASKISIMSDIDDTSKLVAKESNPKKWAVVVGVENYKKAPNVEFAERDALVTKEYFNKLLGVPKENIFYLSNSDATYGELKVLLKDKLKNRVTKDDEVYFYFSGHGVPTNQGDSYLLLNDSDPFNPKLSAYPIKEIYEDLGSLNTSKSYAFLDTCFSGGVARGDEKDSLFGGTRAVMKVNDVALSYNNLTVYAATGKDQLSNSFKEQNHGLFTYYMLKGLGGEADSNKDGKIEEQELQDYIKSNVTTQSRVYGESKYQEPTLKSNGIETIIN